MLNKMCLILDLSKLFKVNFHLSANHCPDHRTLRFWKCKKKKGGGGGGGEVEVEESAAEEEYKYYIQCVSKKVIYIQRIIVIKSIEWNIYMWLISKEQLILLPLVPFLHHVYVTHDRVHWCWRWQCHVLLFASFVIEIEYCYQRMLSFMSLGIQMNECLVIKRDILKLHFKAIV